MLSPDEIVNRVLQRKESSLIEKNGFSTKTKETQKSSPEPDPALEPEPENKLPNLLAALFR